MALKSSKGQGIGNYFDVATGDEYWVSGVKKEEWNRHWAGGGEIMIEESIFDWYKQKVNFDLGSFLKVVDDFKETDISALSELENKPLG